jgi:hypothetical protein
MVVLAPDSSKGRQWADRALERIRRKSETIGASLNAEKTRIVTITDASAVFAFRGSSSGGPGARRPGDGKDAGAVMAKSCWSMRCAEGQTPVAGSNGCTCQPGDGLRPVGAGGGVKNFCTQILCSEGAPTFRDGHCTCGGDGTSGSGPGGVKTNVGGFAIPLPKKLPPVLGAPSTYSDVRYGWPK